MSGWRQLAESVTRGDAVRDNRDNRDNSPAPAVEGALSPVPAWRRSLAGLDHSKPLHGLDEKRWRQLLRDAEWLLEHFASRAARDGWSALDLFGVLPGRDGWAGIADRLRGSRSLVMTADRASWRRMFSGEPETFARGFGEMPKLLPLWDGA